MRTQFLKAEDVADRLNCSRGTIYKMVRLGQIPYTRIGTSGVRFDPQVFEAWLTVQQHGPAPDVAHAKPSPVPNDADNGTHLAPVEW